LFDTVKVEILAATGWLGHPPEFNRAANEVLKVHLSAIVLAAKQAPSG
jgi:hypothetical protein